MRGAGTRWRWHGPALPAFLALAVGLAAPPAGARPSAKKATKRAAKLTNKGYEHFAEGAFDKGIAVLEKAYALAPHPDLVFNIAVAYDQWGGH